MYDKIICRTLLACDSEKETEELDEPVAYRLAPLDGQDTENTSDNFGVEIVLVEVVLVC